MPANNKKTEKRLGAGQVKVGQQPAVQYNTPGIIVKKTFEEALVAGRYSISSFANDFLDVEFYPAQVKVFDEMIEASEITISAANRTGKSFGAGVWVLWKAFYQHIPERTRPEKLSKRNPYKVFTTSLSQDQANLSWNYALSFAENTKFKKEFLRDVVRSPFPEMHIRTKVSGSWDTSIIGSRSLSKGATYILGHSLAAILVDECAFVPKYEGLEDLVLKMRLADWGGTIMRISSPYGKSNHLYRYYLQGQPNAKGVRDPRYYSAALATWDNPYISKAFLEELRGSMSPELFAQNVGGQFISLHDFFSQEVIQGLYDGIEYLLGRATGGPFVMGVDLGAVRDATIITVFDISVEPFQMVYLAEVRNASWASVTDAVAGAIQRYAPVKVVIDETGVGKPIVEKLQSEHDNVVGFAFSASTKPALLTSLQDAAQRRAFVFPFTAATRPLIDQLSIYRLDDKGIDTDYVMSLALAWRAAELATRSNRLETELYDDLLVVPVYGQGRGVPADLVLGDDELYAGGLRFGLDRRTGFFVPIDE